MRAFITGVTGQDGYYLSQFLLERDYEVYGLVRRTAQGHEIPPGVKVVEGDIGDAGMLQRALASIRPQEVYNLAAMSHVGQSFEIPAETFRVNTIGLVNVIEAAIPHGCKIYQASTSEIFGNQAGVLSEESPLEPVSPYGTSKAAAHHLVGQYRRRRNFICAGILFNHESPRRGVDFVTQHVCTWAARVHAGLAHTIPIGNLDAQRDWGHAKDYVRAMWMMLQQTIPEDFVIATGATHSVRELLRIALGDNWERYVFTEASRLRPVELHVLRANPSRANRALGWRPEISFEETIAEMMEAAKGKLAKEGNGNYHGKDRQHDSNPAVAS